jgi:hypothetical protein
VTVLFDAAGGDDIGLARRQNRGAIPIDLETSKKILRRKFLQNQKRSFLTVLAPVLFVAHKKFDCEIKWLDAI